MQRASSEIPPGPHPTQFHTTMSPQATKNVAAILDTLNSRLANVEAGLNDLAVKDAKITRQDAEIERLKSDIVKMEVSLELLGCKK